MEQAQGALRDKVAVVTGAGRGIGRAVAIAFAQAGAKVGCAARTKSELEDTVREMKIRGGEGLVLPTDVTNLSSVERSFSDLVEYYGGLDVLFNNAGGNFQFEELDGSDPSTWRQIVDLNLISTYNCIRTAVPYMKKQGGGNIINMGSGMGHHGQSGISAYCCAKAGLWMLTRVAAQELGPHGINVNELIPGPVETIPDPDRLAEWRRNFEDMGEWVKQPEDVAPLALFLAYQPPSGPSAQSFSLMRRDN
jgi:3-oxoacyl-[acyl-carrier protein] reductase